MTEAVPLRGYGDRYTITRDGEIRNLDGRLLKCPIDGHGYRMAPLWDGARQYRRRLYVLLLETFVGPRPPGYDASHLNGDKLDDSLPNLMWESRSANIRRKVDHGTMICGSKHKCSKLKEKQVLNIKARLADGASQADLARQHGVSKALICSISKGRAWSHLIPSHDCIAVIGA